MAAEAASAGDAGDSIFQQIHDRYVGAVVLKEVPITRTSQLSREVF